MNINNNSSSQLGSTGNANSVQAANNGEDNAEINNQIKILRNTVLVLVTLALTFLGAGLALLFVGAPLAAFLPFFIAAGVTGLLAVMLEPLASAEAQSPDEERPEETSPQSVGEAAPNTNHEQRFPSTSQGGDNRIPNAELDTHDPQEEGGDSSTRPRVIFESKL